MESKLTHENIKIYIPNEEALFKAFESIYIASDEFKKKVKDWIKLLCTKTPIPPSKSIIDKMSQMMVNLNNRDLSLFTVELSLKLEQNRVLPLRIFRDNCVNFIKNRLGISEDTVDPEEIIKKFREGFFANADNLNITSGESRENLNGSGTTVVEEDVKVKDTEKELKEDNEGVNAIEEKPEDGEKKEDKENLVKKATKAKMSQEEERRMLLFALLFSSRRDDGAYGYFMEFMNLHNSDKAKEKASGSIPAMTLSGELRNVVLKEGAEKAVRKYYKTIEPFTEAWEKDLKRFTELENQYLDAKLQLRDKSGIIEEYQEAINAKNNEIETLNKKISELEEKAAMEAGKYKNLLDLESDQHKNNLRIEKNALFYEISNPVNTCFSEIRHSLKRKLSELNEQNISMILDRISITEETINKIKNKL